MEIPDSWEALRVVFWLKGNYIFVNYVKYVFSVLFINYDSSFILVASIWTKMLRSKFRIKTL